MRFVKGNRGGKSIRGSQKGGKGGIRILRRNNHNSCVLVIVVFVEPLSKKQFEFLEQRL